MIILITRKYTFSFSCPSQVRVGVIYPKSLIQSNPLHSSFSSVNFLSTSQYFLTFGPIRQFLPSAGFKISFPASFCNSLPLQIPILTYPLKKICLHRFSSFFFPPSPPPFPSLRPFSFLAVQSELSFPYIPCHS